MPTSLTIVIPTYNEAATLPQVLAEVAQYRRGRDIDVVVVDDGSTDTTRAVLAGRDEGSGVTVVRHKVNRGYGAALKTGIMQSRTELVVTIDADGQHRLEDVDAMVRMLEDQDADLIVGRRVGGESAGWYRQAGKWVIRRVTSSLMRLPIRDLNSGCKLYRTSLVQKYLYLCPDSMAFSDVIALIFVSQRHLVRECPITTRAREAGRGTITTATAFETVLEILNIIMFFNPLRIFLPLSLLCLIAGIGWGVPLALSGRGVSVGSMLSIVMGLIFFFQGLVAEQLSLIRKEAISRIPDGTGAPNAPSDCTRAPASDCEPERTPPGARPGRPG